MIISGSSSFLSSGSVGSSFLPTLSVDDGDPGEADHDYCQKPKASSPENHGHRSKLTVLGFTSDDNGVDHVEAATENDDDIPER